MTSTRSKSSTARRLWRDRLLLTLIGLVLFGAGLGMRDPWPPDEPRFALVAKQMVESSDWLIPRRAGEIYSHKPPLFLWMVAVLYLITGSIRISFLLPSVIAGIATVLLTHDLARRLWTMRSAFLAGLTLLTVFQFVMQARAGQIDAVLTFWITLGVYGLLRHLLLGPSLLWWFVAFAAMGAGIITKGVGFLPLFLLIPFGIASKRRWPNLSSRAPTWRLVTGGLAVMLVVIAMWLVPMWLAVERSDDPALDAYRTEILVRQTAGRYTNPWHHFKPPWYFIASVVPWAWLPLTALLPWALPAWRRRLRRRDARIFLPLAWVVLVVLFFSASPAKRGVYVLPAVPALCLAFAPLLPGLLRLRGVQLAARTLTIAIALILSVAATLVVLKPTAISERVFLRNEDLRFALLTLVGVAIAGLLLSTLPLRRAPVGYALLIWTIFLSAGVLVLPRMNEVSSARHFMRTLRPLLAADEELGMLAWREQFVLQSDRPVKTFGYGRGDFDPEAREAARWLLSRDRRALLVTDEHAAFCFDEAKAIPLDRQSRRNWFLVRKDAIRPPCR